MVLQIGCHFWCYLQWFCNLHTSFADIYNGFAMSIPVLLIFTMVLQHFINFCNFLLLFTMVLQPVYFKYTIFVVIYNDFASGCPILLLYAMILQYVDHDCSFLLVFTMILQQGVHLCCYLQWLCTQYTSFVVIYNGFATNIPGLSSFTSILWSYIEIALPPPPDFR